MFLDTLIWQALSFSRTLPSLAAAGSAACPGCHPGKMAVYFVVNSMAISGGESSVL
jgi:hypothetical protein